MFSFANTLFPRRWKEIKVSVITKLLGHSESASGGKSTVSGCTALGRRSARSVSVVGKDFSLLTTAHKTMYLDKRVVKEPGD